MQLSIHYYVLSLSEQKSRLYEGFRDKLIYIQNTNFPFESFIEAGSFVSPVAKETLLKEFSDRQTSILASITNKTHFVWWWSARRAIWPFLKP